MPPIEHRKGIPVKLLKVMTNYFQGGTEGQVLNLIKHIDRSLFDVSSACLSRSGDILDEFEHLNIPIYEYPINKLYQPSTLLEQIKFAANIRRDGIQIVQSYNFYANCFAIPAARLAGVPVTIASIRDRGVYLTPAKRRLQKYVCGLADRILVNADSIRDWLLEQGYDETKITVIKNGIDLSLYEDNISGESIRQEFDIPSSAPLIVLLARLNPKKGFEEFIQAAALLKEKYPQARYMIVGAMRTYAAGSYTEDTSYLNSLKKMTKKLGVSESVIFTGHRKDTPKILSAANISALPSHSEGLSNTLLESMASGTPCVTTDVGGNPELIQHGVNGLLVPVQNPSALADALDQILKCEALSLRLGTSAKEIAKRQYSVSKMARDTQEIYFNELRRIAPFPARV